MLSGLTMVCGTRFANRFPALERDQGTEFERGRRD